METVGRSAVLIVQLGPTVNSHIGSEAESIS
jgi:hypothetical protein